MREVKDEPVPSVIAQFRIKNSPEVFMKGPLATIAISAIVLMANEASAQHRQSTQTHVSQVPHVFSQTYGNVPRSAAQYPSPRGNYGDMYQSNSLGRQSFINPDREFPVPDHE